MLYESALVGMFNYLWGYKDARGDKEPAALITNAQNPLDQMLGDLIGEVEGKYFLIEFKTTLKGFEAEVSGSKSKVARKNLYEYILDTPSFSDLSMFGHFAAWENNGLQFKAYANAVHGGNIVNKSRFNNDKPIDFNKFYELINQQDEKPAEDGARSRKKGFGISGQDMYDYINCMMENGDIDFPEEQANVIFGFVMPNQNGLKLLATNFDGLISTFKKVHEDIKNVTAKYTPDMH